MADFPDKDLYPDRTEFMQALQEEAQVDPKSPEGALHHPNLIKFAGKVYVLLKAGNFKHLGSNKSRASREIAHAFVRLRKQHAKGAVDDVFKPFANPSTELLWIIQNDETHFGYDRFLRNYSNHLASKVVTKREDRTPSDAVRVAAIMLAEENRLAVVGILSGVKDRAKSDQPVDPAKAWAAVAVRQFLDASFIAPQPDGMDPEDIDGIDPNNPGRMVLERDAQWILDTWKHYLKKKYKAAIKKWDKETGNGDHDACEFSKFCDGNRWLVWVYMMDMENDFLLYSNAQGKPPSFVGLEAGFEAGISEVTNDQDDDDGELQQSSSRSSGRIYTPKQRARAAAAAGQDLRKRGEVSNDLISELRTGFEELRRDRQDKAERKKARREANTQQQPDIFDAIIGANRKREELEKATTYMTPRSRRLVLSGITEEIRRLGGQYREMTEDSSTKDTRDNDDSNDEE
jgi:hypothetical protein